MKSRNESLYHAQLLRYIPGDKIPIYIEYVEKGEHPENAFHDHDFTEIVVVLGGHAVHVAENSFEPISGGDILVLYPGYRHAYRDTGDMEIVNLTYAAPKLPMAFYDARDLPLFSCFFPDPSVPSGVQSKAKPVAHLNDIDLAEVSLLIRRLADELSVNRHGSFFSAMGIFMEVLSKLSRTGTPEALPARWEFKITETIQFMNLHFKEELEIAGLARRSNMSERSFYRYFRQTLGCTPHEYILNRRIQESVVLLERTDKTITEIADECGFYDSNHFTRKFSEAEGVSPGKFRLRHRPCVIPPHK